MLSIPSAYLDNVAPFSTIRFIRLYSHISMEFINASVDDGLSGVECELASTMYFANIVNHFSLNQFGHDREQMNLKILGPFCRKFCFLINIPMT